MDSPPKTPPRGSRSPGSSLMDNLLGLLRVKVIKGINLAVRDVRTSDPYVVIKMGKQVILSFYLLFFSVMFMCVEFIFLIMFIFYIYHLRINC